MKIGLLIIASEVLDGKITDLNTRHLSRFLEEFHLSLESTFIVRDDEAAIMQALTNLFSQCSLVITSGGLGPTPDDLTKMVLGKYFNRAMKYSEQAEKVARSNYLHLERAFPGKDHVYCLLPQDFTALPNSTGFAPGIFFEENGKSVMAGPGVPREFCSLLADHLSPWIKKNILKNDFFENITFRTKKIPEEKIFGEVDKDLWKKLSAFGYVSSLPVLMGVDVGVKIRADNEASLAEKKVQVLNLLKHSPLFPHIWHIGRESLEEVVVKWANDKKLTFAFAESCTGGLCSHKITNVPGSSTSFLGSIISYASQIKVDQLHVEEKIIAQHGVVSLETAKAMASGIRTVLKVDIGISITGVAGPGGGTSETPVGTAFIGVSNANETKAFHVKFLGNRELLKERFAQALLHALAEELASFS